MGYNIPSAIFGLADIINVNLYPEVIHRLASSLLINPFAAVLCAITVMMWILARFARSRLMSFATAAFLVFALIATLAALSLNLGLYIVSLGL